MKIAIIANSKKCSTSHLFRVKEHLESVRTHHHKIVGISFEDNAIKTDFCSEPPEVAIVLGGDGTIISACRSFYAGQIPILGVNFGKLGYLANFRYEDFISTRFREPLVISKRMLLRVRIGSAYDYTALPRTEPTAPCMMAVNDLVIDIGAPFRTTEVQVMVDDQELSKIRGDGIIISTPTGSTAYNLSAGGPIIQPEVEGIVLTPKNPHSLSFRPLVAHASSKIVLKIPNPEGVYAIVDGQEVFLLAEHARGGDGGYVAIDRYPADLQIVEQSNYWETLRTKLKWGV